MRARPRYCFRVIPDFRGARSIAGACSTVPRATTAGSAVEAVTDVVDRWWPTEIINIRPKGEGLKQSLKVLALVVVFILVHVGCGTPPATPTPLPPPASPTL